MNEGAQGGWRNDANNLRKSHSKAEYKLNILNQLKEKIELGSLGAWNDTRRKSNLKIKCALSIFNQLNHNHLPQRTIYNMIFMLQLLINQWRFHILFCVSLLVLVIFLWWRFRILKLVIGWSKRIGYW